MTSMSKVILGAVLASLLGLAIVASAGCAHVQTVATKCEGVATDLIPVVAPALAEGDYEVAIAKATIGVAPCLVVAAIQEIRDSLSAKAQFAGADRPLDSVVVLRHANEWLASHGPK